jgi:pimeloyl-ACP methyl ester carboxylesterase
LAVNLPGHPEGEITCKTIAQYADSVLAFITDSGSTRPVVCGHSMGSAIALTLALDHPDSLGGLILVGAGAKLGVSPEILDGLKSQPMKAIEKTITPMSFHKVDLGLGREARATLSFSNLPVFLNDYIACAGFDVRERLPSLRMKTLIVCGEDDRMTPPKWAEYIHERVRGSELLLVREAGHMLPLERPLELGGMIQGFLSSFSR